VPTATPVAAIAVSAEPSSDACATLSAEKTKSAAMMEGPSSAAARGRSIDPCSTRNAPGGMNPVCNPTLKSTTPRPEVVDVDDGSDATRRNSTLPLTVMPTLNPNVKSSTAIISVPTQESGVGIVSTVRLLVVACGVKRVRWRLSLFCQCRVEMIV
jgi:hypothetical protein